MEGFQSSAVRASSSEPISLERITRNLVEMQSRMRELVNDKPMNEWDKCWEERVTPWDLGQVTPIVSHLVQQQGLLPCGRVLVPGCGAGYDVLALASPNRYVIGVDISEKALKHAQELASSAPNAKYCEFVKTDFFTWDPAEPFDLIFDYMFFCAIDPSMRSAWGKRVSELLKHDGELITLIFPIDDREGGPPYAVSIPRYEEVLHPLGFEAISIENNELAVGRRKCSTGSRMHFCVYCVSGTMKLHAKCLWTFLFGRNLAKCMENRFSLWRNSFLHDETWGGLPGILHETPKLRRTFWTSCMKLQNSGKHSGHPA